MCSSISDLLWNSDFCAPYIYLILNGTIYFIQRRQWHPTPVLLPGKSHGQGSLVGCSPWGREEFTFHFHALEKEMATHSSVLAWRIPGMGEPGRLPSLGCRVRHDWRDSAAVAVAAAVSLSDFGIRVTLAIEWIRRNSFLFNLFGKVWEGLALVLI